MRSPLVSMHYCILPWSRWISWLTSLPVPPLASVTLLSFVLASCASPPLAGPGGDADYRHPGTGDIQHCDNHTTAGFALFGVIGAVVSLSEIDVTILGAGTARILYSCSALQEAANSSPLPPVRLSWSAD